MAYPFQIVACLTRLFPDFDPENDALLIDRNDGQGPIIQQWNRAEPEPTETELQAVEADAISDLSKRDLRLIADLVVRENIATQAGVPVEVVTRDRVLEYYSQWSADMTDPDLTQAQRDTATTRVDWLNTQNQKRRAVNKKIADGTYVTESDVRNAAEW